MAATRLYANISLDWSARDQGQIINRRVKNQKDWESEVVKTLDLRMAPRSPLNAAIDNALLATDKAVTIIPFTTPRHKEAMLGLPRATNAVAVGGKAGGHILARRPGRLKHPAYPQEQPGDRRG